MLHWSIARNRIFLDNWMFYVLILGSLFFLGSDWKVVFRRTHVAAGILYIGCQSDRECHILLGYDLHVNAWSDFSGLREKQDDKQNHSHGSIAKFTACREAIEETLQSIPGLTVLDECLQTLHLYSKEFWRFNKMTHQYFVSYIVTLPDGYDPSIPERFERNRQEALLETYEKEKSAMRWFPANATIQQVKVLCCPSYSKLYDDEEKWWGMSFFKAKAKPCILKDGFVLRSSMVATWCEGFRHHLWGIVSMQESNVSSD
jgi:hypothetical protein